MDCVAPHAVIRLLHQVAAPSSGNTLRSIRPRSAPCSRAVRLPHPSCASELPSCTATATCAMRNRQDASMEVCEQRRQQGPAAWALSTSRRNGTMVHGLSKAGASDHLRNMLCSRTLSQLSEPMLARLPLVLDNALVETRRLSTSEKVWLPRP
jgi:hypothetical protein